LPKDKYIALREQKELSLAVSTDCDRYLSDRFALLEKELQTVESLPSKNKLPDAAINEAGLKIIPLGNAVPKEAQTLM